MLRRKRVKPKTQQLYTTLAVEFLQKYHLNETSPAHMIDRWLDTELDSLYLLGHNAGPGRTLYYALRWFLSLANAALPLASQARQGHARAEKPSLQPPESSEAALLMAHSLVTNTDARFLPKEQLAAAIAILLSFDLYGHASDLPRAAATELRGPAAHQTGPAACWTLTLFPQTAEVQSKTRTTDETLAIGTANPRRQWLQRLAPHLHRLPQAQGLLLGLETARYNVLFKQARVWAHLWASSPHRLRHGGASADALLDGAAKRTDLDIASRGRWQSLTSVRRYRQPAMYLRELARLSPKQLDQAMAAEALLPLLLVRLLKAK